MTKVFRPYSLDQRLLLPPDLREWLPEGHLALFVSDVVDELDLSSIVRPYEGGDGRGQPPYHPAMMVKLLLYAYCIGKPSSRKIERATYDEVAFRVLAADQHPDHDSLAEFRKRHLEALLLLTRRPDDHERRRHAIRANLHLPDALLCLLKIPGQTGCVPSLSTKLKALTV